MDADHDVFTAATEASVRIGAPAGTNPIRQRVPTPQQGAASFRGFRLGVGQRIRWLWSLQKRPAQFQRLATLRIGQKAKVADLDQTGRQHVEEKAADKLDGVQRHEFGLVAMGRVSPAESDAAIRHRHQIPGIAAALASPGTHERSSADSRVRQILK